MRFHLVVPGEPVPKQRPRANRKTGTFYTPKGTRQYETMVALVARAQRVRFGKATVRVDAWIYTGKVLVDDDNVYKSLLDALQAAEVFDNDRQVCEHHIYRVRSKRPRVEVVVEEADERVEA